MYINHAELEGINLIKVRIIWGNHEYLIPLWIDLKLSMGSAWRRGIRETSNLTTNREKFVCDPRILWTFCCSRAKIHDVIYIWWRHNA